MEFIVVSFICLSLLCLLIFQELIHKKERNELTNKIMAKDYKEYYLSEIELRKLEQKKPENKAIKTEFKI